ncbi:hypothetical protein [Erwinia sorbitola]|uniref:DUF4259 domain-containing protein n=1 Tax=Erwinia sorbitola TaxID=2681984 RepID=A0ABW9RH99_9GAMM|nr:hypothetical protein [Erwinia sorbitola]MTD29439.1 hypothetical protein [Erwinia sorbitola]
MGDWSREPWGNDEAADWFHVFWKKNDISLLIKEIEDFSPKDERYDSIRAACYLLQTIGIVYVWPVRHRDILKDLLKKSIEILTNMIVPPDEDWSFLDMWGNDAEVIKAVESQIEILKVRLFEIKN